MAGRGWVPYGLVVGAFLLLGGGLLLLVTADNAADDVEPPRTGIEAAASPSPSYTGGPCRYAPIADGRQQMSPAPELRSERQELVASIQVQYTNPNQIRLGGCGLRVRSYNGQLTGPTLRLKPGDTLRFKLSNFLPEQSADSIRAQFRQEAGIAHIAHKPVPFNTTNVHYHGLHVSPDGTSDNVYLEIWPGGGVPYTVNLPRDHPPGTYWYHAHAHGSTAIQVGSGMAGALIIEDDPNKIPPALKAANEREKILLFQAIQYDTYGEVENFQAFLFPGPGDATECQTGSPLCSWEGSLRRTTVNGQIAPVIQMQPGEVQRWRLIDGTFRESLSLRLAGHSLHEIALDGNYLGRVDTWGPNQAVQLEPGYRSDVLVQATRTPSGGDQTFALVDAPAGPSESLRGVAETREVLAYVRVSGTPMNMALPTDAEMVSLDPFRKLGNLADQATGIQTALFKLGQDAQTTARRYFTVNYAPFAKDHVRTLFLNDVDEWRLGTVGDDDGFPSPRPTGPVTPTPRPTRSPTPAPSPSRKPPLPAFPHIFHIHVNPFQVSRTGPDGKPEMVWKDTLAVKGPPVSVYTKYTDFTGKFVLHCHILDHEDLGMMEAVEIIREEGLSPSSTSGHSH